MIISLDFETRSLRDIRKCGHYAYGLDESTDVLCMAWAIVPEDKRVTDVQLWLPGDPIPDAFYEADELRGWNVGFERVIWNTQMVRRYGARKIPRETWVDTAAEAAALALPRGLGACATVLGLDVSKDGEGRKVMLKLCKPRSRKGGKITWWEDEALYEKLYRYCETDTKVEAEIARVLKPLSKRERQVYLMDQRMNDRGIRLDLELIKAAQRLMKEADRRAGEELEKLTGGKVTKATQSTRIREWCEANGVALPDLQKDTVRDLLELEGEEDDLPDTIRQVLQLRADHAKSSTAKLKALLEYACADGRARGMVVYHGAGTGRWSGKGPQPQNLPRPVMQNPPAAIPMVLAGDYDGIEERFGPVPVVISDMLRSMFVAAPGRILRGGDYSQIEARVLAWIAGQEDLVELFRSGGKVYEDMASFIYGIPVEEIAKDSFERTIGKMTVLGSGFQMGAKTFKTQAKKQGGVDLENKQAAQAVRGYREKNHRIVAFWDDINATVMAAVASPGELHEVGEGAKIGYVVKGEFLWCILPSKRLLAYAMPRIETVTVKYEDLDTGEEKSFTTEAVTYGTVDSTTGKWVRRSGYGGLWTENVVQAMARDLLASAKLRLEAHGYCPVLTVHDEAVTEDPIGHGSVEEMETLMATLPRWAEGLPVAVEAWEGERYRK